MSTALILAAGAALNQSAINTLLGPLSSWFGPINSFVARYSYLAIFVLVTLEYASFPIPTEIVMPLVGYLILAGTIEPLLGFLTTLAGAILGMTADYYAAYLLGKKFVYKHVSWFHIKKRDLDAFTKWFSENGNFAVFIARLLPVVRGFISFPAGFAGMNLAGFYTYSLLGISIWNLLLITFGYYALSLNQIYPLIMMVVLLIIVVFVTYRLVVERIERRERRRR